MIQNQTPVTATSVLLNGDDVVSAKKLLIWSRIDGARIESVTFF